MYEEECGLHKETVVIYTVMILVVRLLVWNRKLKKFIPTFQINYVVRVDTL